MAASGYTAISLYYSTTASATPSAGNLVSGELALNIADGKLYYKDSGGTVQTLAGKGGTGVVAGSNTQIQFNNSGVFGASSSLTWDGTTFAASNISTAGSLTLSGGTANGVAYLNGSKVVTSGSALTFDGTNLSNTGTSGVVRVRAGSGSQYVDLVADNGSVPKLVYSQAWGSLVFGSDSSGTITELMRLTSTGLGIGTSSPTSRVEAVAPAGDNITALFRSGDATAANNAGGGFRSISSATAASRVAQVWLDADGANFGGGDYFYIQKNGNSGNVDLVQYSNAAMTFSTNATTRMTLDSSGNLGIGTSSPAVKLDVAGNATIQNGVLTIGKDTVYDAFINTPESMYFNVDSDGNSTGNRFVWGTDRTGTSGGTEWMRLDSSGNLGLGVTPSAWGSGTKAFQLQGGSLWSYASGYIDVIQNGYFNGTNNIYATTAAASFYRQNAGQHQWFNAPSGTAGNAITFTQAMTLDASGNLGVGATSARGSSKLDIRGDVMTLGSNASYFATIDYSAGTGLLSLASESGGGIAFKSGTTERARIDSSGNLLVGQTSHDQQAVGFSVTQSGIVSAAMTASTSGANCYHLYSTGAAAYRFYVGLGGTINATSTTITGISDQRLKENIRDLDDGLAKVMALQPRKFDWKEGKGADIKNARGFIAQEFETVFPDMIEEWLDPAPEGEEPYKAVNANLIPVLVKALQELKSELDSVKAELAILKGV